MLMSLGSAAKPQKPVSHFPLYPSVAATQPSKRDARLSRAVSATGLRLLLLSLLQLIFRICHCRSFTATNSLIHYANAADQ